MILSAQNYKIELFSEFLNQLNQQNCFKLNGVSAEKNLYLFEFEALIDDEEIVFDVIYDQNSNISKLHVDQDYERSFHQYFNQSQFENAVIKFNYN